MIPPYMLHMVICRADTLDRQPLGDYVLATRQLFYSRVEAEQYARTISAAREPIIVWGRFGELRLGTEAK